MIRELLSRLATLPACGWYAVDIQPPPTPPSPQRSQIIAAERRRTTPIEATPALALREASAAR